MTEHRAIPSPSRRSLPVVVGIAALVGWALYRPDVARPFDALDFGEFLPLLKQSPHAFDQLRRIAEYSLAQSGRVNPIPLMTIVLKWHLFGSWSPGWQLMHATVLLIAVSQVYLLVRRVGASVLGGLVASLTMVVAPAAAESWIRLTIGEPIGLILALALSLRAFRFQESAHWAREVCLMGVGLASIVLTKELLAPVFALPLLIALTARSDREFARPRLTRRNLTLVATACGIVALFVAASIFLLLRAGRPSYGAAYGRDFQTTGQVFANWIATLIPFGVDAYPGSLGWVLALLALTVLLASGWRIGFHDVHEGRRARCLLAVAFLFPLCGALVYAPWRFYEARYAYPYLVGTAILLGMATTYLERWPAAIGRQTARVASIIVGVFAATGAWAAAGKADALQRAVDAVIETVHTANRADSVFVTAPPRPLGLEWTGVGPSMSRLARATDRPWPPVREIRCEDVRAPAVNVVVVTLQSFCVGLPFSTHVAHQFPVLNWAQWSLDHDSVYFDLQLRDEREPTAH